ncbi:MAG: glycosyltransferase [Thermoplasmata archaeon]
MVCAIVVTYNRKFLLERCIRAMLDGSVRPDAIYIIDNASSDGTEGHIKLCFKDYFDSKIIRYIRLSENTGGAGGFYEGLKIAMEESCCEYFWLMDDDAEPDKNALKFLLNEIEKNKENKCFVSIATDWERNELAWGTGIILNGKTHIFELYNQIPDNEILKAPWAPFLGFLIPRKIVEHVGLPRKEYFIWGDDVEYSSRIWNSGYEINYVKKSIIYHPVLKKIKVSFLGREVVFTDAEDWKQYYGIRNDVYTLSRQKKILPMVKRIIFYFLVWKVRGMNLKTLHYYLKGLYHGLVGKLGKYPN